MDELLTPLLRARSDSEWQDALSDFLTRHADPVIHQVLRRKLRMFFNLTRPEADAEDIRSQVYLQLIARLSQVVTDPAANPIENVRAYTSVIAGHCCDEYLRQKYPKRWSLKNRIRYLLTHDPSLARWQGAAELSPAGIDWQAQLGAQAHRLELRELLGRMFTICGGPLEMDALVGAVAALLGIKDEPAGVPCDTMSDARRSIVEELEDRSYVGLVWNEILELPPGQRAALLLNLRDAEGHDVLEGVLLAGVASLRDIAAALEMLPERLAQIWNQLPLNDNEIGNLLSKTRQQVINLRKAARDRLSRRFR